VINSELMKQNKVIKSFEELSPELLVPEVAKTAKTAETNPRQSGLVTAETKSIQTVQPIRFLTEVETRGYRGWGINE
jgi:hypothetical protein